MNCQEARSLKSAYADGELDVVKTTEFAKHLGGCIECSRAQENLRALKSAVGSEGLYFKAPAQLKRQVRAALQVEAGGGKSNPLLWWRWLKLAIPAAAGALLAILVLMIPAREDRLVQEITASHVRSLMADHLLDVISSDQHTVKPWFDGKVDFAPPVIDLAPQGFPLAGGRLDYEQNRPVAALVYKRQKHVINLFVWPTTANVEGGKQFAVSQGYNLVHWEHAGMTFWAVSDLNREELRQFAELIK
jgi:anti-sigma factor RsiW